MNKASFKEPSSLGLALELATLPARVIRKERL